jgi:archaellum biogenesis ATPase FlaH
MNNKIDIKLVIARCLSIIFRESQLENDTINSKDYIRKILGDIKIIESGLALDQDNKIISSLKNYVLEMTRKPTGHVFEYNEIIQRIKLICDNDNNLFESIRDSIALEMKQDELTKCIFSYRKELDSFLKEKKLRDLISEADKKIKYRPHEINNTKDFVTDLINSLSEYQIDNSVDAVDHAIVSEVDFSDTNKIISVLNEVKGEADGAAIIQTPWQGLNRMLRGGLRRGQLTTISALQHHNKSGLSLGILCGAALYNNPMEQMIDKTKKPMILLISAEDEMPRIIGTLYMLLRGNLDGVQVTDEEMANLDLIETSKYLNEQLEKTNGYKFKTLRVNPSEWTYIDICNYINKQEADGYEIHLLCIDYLNMFPKTGCRGDGEPARIQNLFQVMRNFLSAKKIATITPHQLSGDANELFRQGKSKDLVNLVAGGNYYADCKGISREVDCELFIHIVNESGRFYQTIRRGKHRVIGKTDEKFLYLVLPFEDVGGLRFDIGKLDTSLSKVGSKRREDGTEELPYDHMFEF